MNETTAQEILDSMTTCSVNGCGHKFSTTQDWQDHYQARHNVKSAETFFTQIEHAFLTSDFRDDIDLPLILETIKAALEISQAEYEKANSN
jgi:hypothetical protein